MSAERQHGPAWALIGCGPRGLAVLERFVTLARRTWRAVPATLHVIEPGEVGVGIHLRDQPDYLLLNTIACQVTAFVDECMTAGGGVAGPSLYDWAKQRGTLVRENTGAVRAVRATDHLPRALFGEYLVWAARRIIDASPSWLRVLVHRDSARAVRQLPDDRERVVLESGGTLDVDHVTLTIGHSGTAGVAASDAAWITTPYPLPTAIETVRPGERVGLLGAGLTAMDVVAAMTVGRGGTYRADGERLRYVAGGQEPEIVLTTRSGLPARARPLPYQGSAPSAAFLTGAAIEDARRRVNDGRLDFGQSVMSLVRAEMRHRVHLLIDDPIDAEQAADDVLALWDETVPSRAMVDADAYRAWFAESIAGDLREARGGLDGSAVKFAFEVVRDYRDILRTAIDEPGLTDHSVADFFGSFVSAVNRNVIGPQLERNAELLALIDARVILPGPGPAARLTWHGDHWSLSSTSLATPTSIPLDRVVSAFSPTPSVSRTTNPVIGDLRDSGRLRPWRREGVELGAALDRDGHPIDADNRSQNTLSVIGPLAEGSSYYNHYVLSPGTPSRAVADADRIVRVAYERTGSPFSGALL
ncbi:MAG: FAD/NAD(P)-binding protein [Actinomycetota bacterium]|nr:FAD/NAD(P)-binding protein [Actinomycetota bacterium]